jgi:cyclic-di-AMP phosphodiesterase PgpH
MNPMHSIGKRILQVFLPSKTSAELRDSSWLERMKTPTYVKWIIGLATALAITFLLSPSFRASVKEYRVGDVATKEIKANQDFLVPDERSTGEKRLEAEKSILSVYDYDPSVQSNADAKIRSAFRRLEKGPDSSGRSRNDLEASLRMSLTQKDWSVLERNRFSPLMGESALKLLGPVLSKGVISDKDLLDPDSSRGILIRDVQTHGERKDLPPFNFLDYKEAKAKLRAQAVMLSPPLDRETQNLVVKIGDAFLRPNITFNKTETEDRKLRSRELVSPVYFQVRRGEVILRPGDRVREDHVAIIHAMGKVQQPGHIVSILIGMALLAFLLIASTYDFATKNIRKVTLSQKDLIFFATLLVGILAFQRLFQLVTGAVGFEFPSVPSSSFSYLFPIAAGAMLVRIVINSEAAIVFSILISYFFGFMVGNQLQMFIFAFIGSIVGAHKVAQCEHRDIILKAGLFVGGANVLTIIAFTFLSDLPFRVGFICDMISGALSGVLASILILGITPIVESVFAYTTDIKLLELASMDHPLIKDLMLRAPGTYHHSVMVGSLAEAAAKSVSANPLLARVSAYYHDIGKLKKPLYYIENSGLAENRHDHLTPNMSSLVLLSHVKDGLELAREKHLGGRIAHIIQQHHGTTLISYFYERAKGQQAESLSQEDYRYPGPKPQTKEAGLVMLADEVEAASRALSDPNPSRIKSVVQRIINNAFTDGQLEECELSLKDLHKIDEAFTRILIAIFHQRIEYPVAPSSEDAHKKTHEDPDPRSAKTLPFKPRKDKKSGSGHIGRIGAS